MADDGQILVTKTTRASPDGTAVHRYAEGETYGPESDPPMPAELAATFLREGWGQRCDEEEPPRICAEVPPVEPTPAEPDAACIWCRAPYTARTGHGGPAQRFCSDTCRAAFHRGARRWKRKSPGSSS